MKFLLGMIYATLLSLGFAEETLEVEVLNYVTTSNEDFNCSDNSTALGRLIHKRALKSGALRSSDPESNEILKAAAANVDPESIKKPISIYEIVAIDGIIDDKRLILSEIPDSAIVAHSRETATLTQSEKFMLEGSKLGLTSVKFTSIQDGVIEFYFDFEGVETALSLYSGQCLVINKVVDDNLVTSLISIKKGV